MANHNCVQKKIYRLSLNKLIVDVHDAIANFHMPKVILVLIPVNGTDGSMGQTGQWDKPIKMHNLLENTL